MSIVDGIILGLIQGIAEFLPISSTGHLVLARELFKFGDINGLAFDAILQLATSLAVLLYFRKDFMSLFQDFIRLLRRKPGNYNLLYAIIFGTIPGVLLGLLFEDYIANVLRSSVFVAMALVLGSLLFYIAEKYGKKSSELTPKKGVVIGVFQALALIPGFSRSGSTLSGGLLLGLSRIEAARFSFLLSFPIIFGAGLYKLIGVISDGAITEFGLPLLSGSIASFGSGILAIHYLLKYLKNHTLWLFIIYRLLLAAIILVIGLA